MALAQERDDGSFAPRFVDLGADEPGLDEEQDTLFIALPIINKGTATASNIQVRSIKLASATRITPGAFPVTLGDIAASQRAVLDASFTSNGLAWCRTNSTC